MEMSARSWGGLNDYERRERRREHTKRLEGRLRKFRGQLLREGDHVRVRLANFQSGVRQQIKMRNRKRMVMRFSPEICVVKGVIDRSVSKLYTLATQDGDAILNPNGKTRVFQRDDLLKAPMNTPKTAFTLKKVNRLNPKILHPYWMLLFTKTVGETDGWQRVMTCGWTLIYCR